MLWLDVVYKVKKGKREDFLQELLDAKIGIASNAEDGCVRYDYCLPVGREDELWIIEIWRDADAQAKHCETPHVAELRRIKEKYVSSTTITRFNASKE